APGLGVVLIELKPRHVDIWMKSLGDRASALGPSSTPRPPCAGLFNSQLNGRSWTEIRLRRGFAPRSASPRHRTRRSAFNSLIRSMHGNSSRAPAARRKKNRTVRFRPTENGEKPQNDRLSCVSCRCYRIANVSFTKSRRSPERGGRKMDLYSLRRWVVRLTNGMFFADSKKSVQTT